MKKLEMELLPSSFLVGRFWGFRVISPGVCFVAGRSLTSFPLASLLSFPNSVVVTAGEVLASSLPSLNRNIHPITIISAYKKALNDALSIIDEISLKVDTENRESMIALIKSTIGTKFISQWADLMCGLALDAVRTVAITSESGRKEVDVKRYARIEKVGCKRAASASERTTFPHI